MSDNLVYKKQLIYNKNFSIILESREEFDINNLDPILKVELKHMFAILARELGWEGNE